LFSVASTLLQPIIARDAEGGFQAHRPSVGEARRRRKRALALVPACWPKLRTMLARVLLSCAAHCPHTFAAPTGLTV
jgi:hypothetical protein